MSSTVAAGTSLHGGNGDDQIFGGSLADDLNGDRGDDRLFGLGGDDALYADVLYGDAPGADRLLGGRGRDFLYAIDSNGDDRLLGGPRHDRSCADAGDLMRSVERRFSAARCLGT